MRTWLTRFSLKTRLLGLLGLLGGNYPALCDSSGFALGRCS